MTWWTELIWIWFCLLSSTDVSMFTEKLIILASKCEFCVCMWNVIFCYRQRWINSEFFQWHRYCDVLWLKFLAIYWLLQNHCTMILLLSWAKYCDSIVSWGIWWYPALVSMDCFQNLSSVFCKLKFKENAQLHSCARINEGTVFVKQPRMP